MDTKTAVITGASSGIGKAYAYKLASEGYNLLLISRNKEKLDIVGMEIRNKYPVEVSVNSTDLSIPSQINKTAEQISHLPRIDFLINSAGYTLFAGIEEYNTTELEKIINLHILACSQLSLAAAKRMKQQKQGVIVNLSSIAALLSLKADFAYLSTKSFVHSFSMTLHRELETHNIKVQSLCPGFVRTAFHDNLSGDKKVKFEKIPSYLWFSPEKVVDYSFHKSSKGGLCIPGLRYKLIYFIGSNPLARHLLKLFT